MRPETNKEIDLLLRRMARENGPARDGVQSDDQHLDADELSSYAQNALPAAAHARYMAHLSDCPTCRRLITELSLSLGSAAAPAEAVPAPSRWQAFLANLFSPMVLRYAVPALGVVIVAVVGFVVMRRQAQYESFAKLQESRPVSSATAPSEQEPSAGLVDSVPKTFSKVEGQNAKADTRGNPHGDVADARVAGTAGAAPATPPKEEKSGAQTQPSVGGVASATANAEPPQPEAQQETVTVAKKQPEIEREKAAVQAANDAPRDQMAAAKRPDAAEQAKATPSPASTFGYSGLRGLSAGRAETAKPATGAKTGAADKDAGNADADEVTRTIAGRRFRKQGNAWIDTAYESSTATVNMDRNSEQFRALVADEPAIGTIAKQLDGEVIVVWKGHAYRIR